MAFTYTTSGAAVRKAGKNVNTTISVSGAALDDWSDQSEGSIDVQSERLFLANYGSLNSAVKQELDNVTSSMIAMNLIGYDLPAYPGSSGRTLLDINDDIINRGLRALDKFKSNTLQKPI